MVTGRPGLTLPRGRVSVQFVKVPSWRENTNPMEARDMSHHLSLTDRSEIEARLRLREGVRVIARRLGVARSTVAREVAGRAVPSDKGAKGRLTNRCVHRSDCHRRFACAVCRTPMQTRRCSACPQCNKVCPDYREIVCEWLKTRHHVCNGCPKEGNCVLRKRYYIAEAAHGAYRRRLVDARAGAAITDEERTAYSDLLAKGLAMGQSVHHIVRSRPDEFTMSEKTVYTYIHTGVFQSVGLLDLPMAPKLKPRRRKGAVHRVNPRAAQGRGFADFRRHLEDNPDATVVEMDSVEGRKGGRLLLTLNFDVCGLMLAFVRDANTSRSVIDVLDAIERAVGLDMFQRLFPVILTDNGTEFSNPDALETPLCGEGRRTRVFYCDPYSSWQKPNVENNHLNIRKIFPKGESMDHVTQDRVDLAMSHMNSMLRRSLGDVTAIDLFAKCYGEDVLPKLGIVRVAPGDVRLTPELTRR